MKKVHAPAEPQGGIPSLPSRYIQGPGDGMSDSVPAVIDGQEPAALSSGEYVVNAQAVSALGNGSNEAGAKVLDMLVQRILAAQTGGKGKQMQPMDLKKLLKGL